MKKHCISSFSLLLSVGSFGFWELEGPFGQNVDTIDRKDLDIDRKENFSPVEYVKVISEDQAFSNCRLTRKRKREVYCRYNYLCMYNKQTGYSIGYINSNMGAENDNVIIFLLGNNNKYCWATKKRHLSQLYDNSSFYFIKEKPGLDLDELNDPIFGTQLRIETQIAENKAINDISNTLFKSIHNRVLKKNPINLLNANWKRIQPIEDEIISTLGIVITNKEEGKIEIKPSASWKPQWVGFTYRQLKPLDFQVQLVKYFDKNKTHIEFAKDVQNSLLTGDGLSARKLNGLKFVSQVGEKEIERLNNSRILDVYGVVKNDSGQDAIIWGLAEDKTNPEKRVFHWITDLEDDISVLLKQ